MNDRNNIYISALLHDIGKFIERSKNKEWSDIAFKYVEIKEASSNYAHRRFSAAFVNKFKDKKDFLSDSVESLVLHHHNDNPAQVENYLSIDQRGVYQKIIRIADDLASAERSEDDTLEPGKYYKANLEIPFNDIKITLKGDSSSKEFKLDKKYYYLKSTLRLDDDKQFPVKNTENEDNAYKEMLNQFLHEFNNIEDEDALLSLMEKFLVHIPAQSPFEVNGRQFLYKPDINLYDHSRVVAAIAIVLYEEFIKGLYKGKDKQILSSSYISELSNPAVLVCGNVNGIQDFIFNVKSKRAAKNLKGRSYFIQILTDIAAKFIIDRFELKTANLLYNGGGNFFILAPNFRIKDLDEIREKISKAIIDTGLFLSIGYSEVTFEDFKNFGKVFDSAVKASNEDKKRKFHKLKFEEIFNPIQQKIRGEEEYFELTETLQKSKNYFYGNDDGKTPKSKWEKVFNELGYKIDFHDSNELIKQEVVLNDIDFSGKYQSFRFAVKDLPKWSEDLEKYFRDKLGGEFKFEEESGEKLNSVLQYKRYAQLAKFDTGTEKIGVLKMDVDNLGIIFKDGLIHAKPTIGRIAFLSRTMKWFFEGYMNCLLNKEEFKNRIYVIFSGGDDFFLVGAWNTVFNFSIDVREEFRRFVAHHPGINLSAALLVIDETYPIKQIANLAEERLEDAKQRTELKTKIKIKDAISVFNTVLSWGDFYKAKELRDKIVKIIELTEGNRAIINKIQKSSSGFASIQSDALFKGIIKIYKVWRLSYYLRDLVNVKPDKPNADEIKEITKNIIKLYEELFFKAFQGEETSIQIFPVAARWAELETRNLETNKE
jgi:CRISPR-associated protein Csm1